MKFISSALIATFALTGVASDFNSLDMRWTFGAHEPLTMYRRKGQRTTGGIEGSSYWVKDWLDWFDCESPKLMRELGLNWCHARYYKGLGWETEKKDLPNVRRFVSACHENGVKVLAYVQFMTLYYETMTAEIPDIQNWCMRDENGDIRSYHSSYYRSLPCPNCREFEEYLTPIMVRAVTEEKFDGVMFDNCFAYECHCERCQKLFREHIAALPDFEERFGFSERRFIRMPTGKNILPEVKDPLVAEWLRWRAERMLALFTRFRAALKKANPNAILSANPQPMRSTAALRNQGLDMSRFGKLLDVIVMQSANYPAYDAKKDLITSRVRDLKALQDIDRVAVALCDNDSMMTPEQEKYYLLPMVEDLVLGGIPTDRTIVSPAREPGFIDRARLERRRPLLKRFNDYVVANRAILEAPSYKPVRLLWTPSALMLSTACHQNLAAVEEICIRRHIPYGYLLSTAEGFAVPEGTEVIVVPGQTCLSVQQRRQLAAWAQQGGKIIVSGASGDCDEQNRQFFTNSFPQELPKTSNVVWHSGDYTVKGEAKLGWKHVVPAPTDDGDAFIADLKRVGFALPYELKNVPKWAFVETKQTAKGFALHIVNYRPAMPLAGVDVVADGFSIRRLAPFDTDAAAPNQYVAFELTR